MFDIDKMYLMRKEIPVQTNKRTDIYKSLKTVLGEKRKDDINIFLDQISNSTQRDAAKSSFPDIWKEYVKIAYKSSPYTEGRRYRNNKIVDMTWEVLTHEDTADKVLNPGGFEEQKYEGYLAQAARITGKPISELEHLSTNDLKKICQTDKNLAFIGTHTQFYKQNAAAGSILAIFAVAKVAHACLESNGFQVDVNSVCGIENPYSIMGLTLFDKVELDPQKDIEGNFIGKTLGSLVASAADAVKDPVLNLMNINSDTVNILNTLVRMGLPFRKASRLLSTQVVSDLLTRYNKEKLDSYTSLNKVLETMLAETNNESDIIDNEDLTEEEVNNAILNRDDKTDYKILLALQRVNLINSAMRSLNFATRFNSISSAVGPLIIDNLKIENNLNNFAEGIYKDGLEVGFEEVFEEHPILRKFQESVELAAQLFDGHMPANSNQFRNILSSIENTSLLSTLYRDRKIFSKFNDFYQSYLLLANNVVASDKKTVLHYIQDFPKEFAKKNYKEKYAGNPFIDAIRFDVDANSKNPILKINVTGLDTETKSKLTSGWLDLYKSGSDGAKLAADLFYYCFYKGGIGFNPKTFMSLLPVQLRMNIRGYKETFEKLPDIEESDVVTQFLRNNWNEDKIVPYRKFERPLSLHDGGYVDIYGEEADKVKNLLAFKTTLGKNTLLFIKDSYNPDTNTAVFKIVSPLGNNNEFMEISFGEKQNSYKETPTEVKNNTETGEKTEDIANNSIEEEVVNIVTSEKSARTLAQTIASSYFTSTEKETLKELGKNKRFQAMRDIIVQKLREKEVDVHISEVDDIAAQFC